MARTAKGGGSRGAIAQSAHLKLAAGATTPEGDEVPLSAAATVPSKRPEMPTGMTLAEQRAWEQLADALAEAGLIAACDGYTLELAVRHYCAAVAAHKNLKRNGPTIYDDKNKRYAKNPASQLFREHSQMYAEYAKLLGLAFAARARIPVAPEGGESGSSNPFSPPRAG